MNVQILPSLLAADVGRLEDEARRADASGADALHLDIMDGNFVPNISMGPTVVEMAKRIVRMPLSVHLMLLHPDQYVSRFVEAGADTILIHIEADCNVPETLEQIRESGVKVGITLNPETSEDLILPVLDQVDEVLCMTVHPGYGGQAFMPEVLPKIRRVREYVRANRTNPLSIMVDGGIGVETAAQCAAQGANSFVAGTTLFRADDMAAEVARIRESASKELSM